MDETTTIDDTGAAGHETSTELLQDELLQDELLVEEISIDGMCGVY
jgi:mycofactocin precursor